MGRCKENENFAVSLVCFVLNIQSIWWLVLPQAGFACGAVCPSLGPILLGFLNVTIPSRWGTELGQCSRTPVKVAALPLAALGTSSLNFPIVGRRGTITLDPGCREARHRPKLLHRHTPWQQQRHRAPDPRPLLASTVTLPIRCVTSTHSEPITQPEVSPLLICY